MGDDYRKFGTFPSKPTPITPMSNNKFQRMASIHKQQEESGNFFPKKIHFGGNPKLQYREGGEKLHKTEQGRAQKFQKNGQAGANKKFERGEKKFGGEKKNLKGNKRDQKEQGDKKFKNKKVKKGKGDPVKGTSTEYIELANSDDDEDVVDVTDMISKSDDDDNGDEAVIPLLNTSTKRKSVKNAKIPAVVSKFSSKNRFNALGEYEEGVEEQSEEPPRKRQRPSEDDGKEEEEEEGAEDVDGESGSDDDEEERLKFREEISKMPIGKVREMKEKLGIKLFNKTYFGTSEVEKKRKETKKAEISKSENHGQHRPKEISSKRHVSTFRNIYGEHEKGTKKKRWDPRFDSRAGDFKEVCFENNYQFLDEIRNGEIQDLRSEYKVARTDGDEKKAARLKNTLQKMETSEKTRAEKRRQAETRKELHDDNIQRMLRGEAPVFRTKAQVRRIDAEKKFDELKKGNNLDKYMKRKAKKEAAKQKKSRPPFEGYGFQ